MEHKLRRLDLLFLWTLKMINPEMVMNALYIMILDCGTNAYRSIVFALLYINFALAILMALLL